MQKQPNETMDNFGIMDIIIDEYKKYQGRREKSNKPLFGGLKVIYCTPRAFNEEDIQFALDECLKMKQNHKYSRYIAGKFPLRCSRYLH